MQKIEFSALTGQTLRAVTGAKEGSKSIIFTTIDGREFSLSHNQSCCEEVSLADVCGEVRYLLFTPILLAEEVSSDTWPADRLVDETQESFTWTFYKLVTNKGAVTLRWLGTSNGCYSEKVDFYAH